MAYQSLIKNFNRIRDYMRDFYVYGFRTREEFDQKSARSYDDERRHIEEYLGDRVQFRNTRTGKAMYISMDSRTIPHNPLYQAFRSKSFTDPDVTLHFYILEVLHDGAHLAIPEIADRINERSGDLLPEPLIKDDSQLRRKLNDYAQLGILRKERQGRQDRYYRTVCDLPLETLRDAIDFYEEMSPIGVIGCYVQDHLDASEDILRFRNHYYLNACDSEILETLLCAIHEHRLATITSCKRGSGRQITEAVIPMRLYLSAANGRSYLLYVTTQTKAPELHCKRTDIMLSVRPGAVSDSYETARDLADRSAPYQWGTATAGVPKHVEIDIEVNEGEEHIRRRLERERRCGTVTDLGNGILRYSADVYDPGELRPWIRSYIGRIVRIESPDGQLENRIKKELSEMLAPYGESHAV